MPRSKTGQLPPDDSECRQQQARIATHKSVLHALVVVAALKLLRPRQPSALEHDGHAVSPHLYAVDMRGGCHMRLWQVVEAGAGAPWLLGASLPPGMTGSEVRTCAVNLSPEPGMSPPCRPPLPAPQLKQVLNVLRMGSHWYA